MKITKTLLFALSLLASSTAMADSLLSKLLPKLHTVVEGEGVYSGGIDAASVTIVSEKELGTFDYKIEGLANEGYRLIVTPEGISIKAASEVGVIRARQTLAQLLQDDGSIECCDITDYPAFKVRGYMHDVGRSFISYEELKKEIDLLSRFKVNVFHWHLTDNQGFRFESFTHPELNQKGFKRFVGKYYTQEQCRELEAYAAERGVMIIPEIDMPGHSQSFETATGVTMSSAKGKTILKDVLSELAAAFPLATYLHVGADESGATVAYVKEMTDYVHSLGKKTVCWNRYGGSVLVTPSAMGIDMTTNWATAGSLVSGVPNVDMRYFYTNHFDIFADIAGAYRSTIFDSQRGSTNVGGVSIGIWNDRYVGDERQIIAQNNLYAAVIAMTERAWMGGGKQYIEKGRAYLPNDGEEYEEFADWEDRFLFYKDKWLSAEPIPYVKQSNVRWNITSAYDNGGTASKAFDIETADDLIPQPGSVYATGAGIWLNHIWAGIVGGVLSQGAQPYNQTRYAWTYVYSPTDQEVGAQIEIRNYSRSDAGLVPKNKKWDIMESRVWINDKEILPTWNWTNANTNPSLEAELGNLNFPARDPLKVQLHAGWNKVLLKLPFINIGNPNGRANKWQYTFVFTTLDGSHAVDGLIYSPKKMMEGEDFTNPKYEPVYPTASTELEQHFYAVSTPLRDGYYVTSSGLSSIMTSLKSPSDLSYWKFVQRNDGTYDIINHKDGGYISPTASQNSAVKCVKSRPTRGWTLEPGDTDGYFIIYSGTTQLNQTKSSQSFQLYNWGYKSVTGQDYNTTDTGCQFLIKENEDLTVIIDGINTVLAEPSLSSSVVYDLQGRPANAAVRPRQIFIKNGRKRMQ